MEEVRGASFAKLKILFGSTVVDTTSMCFQLNALNPPPPCLGRERAAVVTRSAPALATMRPAANFSR